LLDDWKGDDAAVTPAGIPKFPHWLCQPYVREQLVPNKRRLQEVANAVEDGDAKRPASLKAAAKAERKAQKKQRVEPVCSCGNLASANCQSKLCKLCCRKSQQQQEQGDAEATALCEFHSQHKRIVRTENEAISPASVVI